MNLTSIRALASFVAAAVLASAASAQEPRPGSVLLFPSVRSGNGFMTMVSVTNTNPNAPNGSVQARFHYVNAIQDPADPFMPLSCTKSDRWVTLTPADTLSVLVFCHQPDPVFTGYVLVEAVDAQPPRPKSMSHNYLIGSETVFTGTGAVYTLNASSFQSLQPDGLPTDVDLDGLLDFDGVEYTACPDTLYVDSYLSSLGGRLALVSMTGGTQFTTTVNFNGWNNNEFPLSTSQLFRCWFEMPLDQISIIFIYSFQIFNTPTDPTELDTNCDGVADLLTGWFTVQGVSAASQQQSVRNAAVMGALTSGSLYMRGQSLWRTGLRTTGSFLNFGQTLPN